jgi:tetratricopeptide (TPR) repeat protein
MSNLASVTAILLGMGKKELAKRVVNLFHKNMNYLNEFEQVSYSYLNLGIIDKAIDVCEKALVLSPNPQAAYMYRSNLASMYLQAGRPNRALIYININEKLSPNKELALMRLQVEQELEIKNGIQKTGYWNKNLAKKHHAHSSNLSKWLANYLDKNKTTYDFGCGIGSYLKDLKDEGFADLIGFEGDVPDNKVFENIKEQDLSVPFNFDKKGNMIFLEVGEHIPAEYQNIVLDNVCNACDGKLVLSWAVRGQGGTGHVNELDNYEVIPEIQKRGFKFLPDKTKEIRAVFVDDPCPWFLGSIMIFERAV